MPALFRSLALCCGLALAAAESVPASITVDAAKPGAAIAATDGIRGKLCSQFVRI